MVNNARSIVIFVLSFLPINVENFISLDQIPIRRFILFLCHLLQDPREILEEIRPQLLVDASETRARHQEVEHVLRRLASVVIREMSGADHFEPSFGRHLTERLDATVFVFETTEMMFGKLLFRDRCAPFGRVAEPLQCFHPNAEIKDEEVLIAKIVVTLEC